MSLKPLSERKISADALINRLRPKLSEVPGAQLFLQSAQDIRTGGRQANAGYQYTLRSDNLEDLRAWGDKIRDAFEKLPELTDVNSDQSVKGLETSLQFDRTTAARLGVTTQAIDNVLNDAFSQRNASTIYAPLNQYYVIMEVAPEFLQSPESLKDIYVQSKSGAMVPLTAFASFGLGTTPLAVNHQGQFVSTTIAFNLADGVSLSQASTAIDRTMSRLGVPTTIHGGFAGNASAFQQGQSSQPFLILAALLAIYIVLGVLYESYVHPLTILSTLPSAGVGAILALLVFGQQFTVIAFIGVILLIGIVKKNAIMMIDFALDAERHQNLDARDAVFQACMLRFRPIMMTTMAAMLGALPLAIGFGEGSEMRRPLGISIVGGLLFSQLLTLYTTPVVYLYLDRFRLWAKARWERRHPPAQVRRRRPRYEQAYAKVYVYKTRHRRRDRRGVPDRVRGGTRLQTPEHRRSRQVQGKRRLEPGLVQSRARRCAQARHVVGNLRRCQAQRTRSPGRRRQPVARAGRSAISPGRRTRLAGARGVLADGRRQRVRDAAQAATATAATSSAAAAPSSPIRPRARPRQRRRHPARASPTSTRCRCRRAGNRICGARCAARVEQQAGNAQASAATLESTRLSLHAELATDYFQLRILDEQKRLLDETVDAYRKSLQLTQNQYDVGVAARADVVQADTQLKQAQVQAIDLGVQRTQLEHAIALLIGKTPAEFSLDADEVRHQAADDSGRRAVATVAATSRCRRRRASGDVGERADRCRRSARGSRR